MDRATIAYLIIAAVALAVATFVAFQLYYSRDRVYRRRKRREIADHDLLMAEREAEDR